MPTEKYNKILSFFPQLKGKMSKFIPGILRWEEDEDIDLDNSDDIAFVDTMFKLIDLYAAKDFFNPDLNGCSPEIMSEILELAPKDPREEDILYDYSVKFIPSYKEAEKYKRHVNWTILRSPEAFAMFRENGNRFYIALNQGWESVACIPGVDFPYDNYGVSMLLIEVSKDNKIQSVTPRWNNLSGSNAIICEADLKYILGNAFNEVFKTP